MGKLKALREAQLWMLREGHALGDLGTARTVRLDKPTPLPDSAARFPPYYWAGFVLSGDWR
jgi:CHAT domain-containing protein